MMRELARAIVVRLIGCRHLECYRERRTLYGANVWHFVCRRCGAAIPMVERSEAETRALALEGKR